MTSKDKKDSGDRSENPLVNQEENEQEAESSKQNPPRTTWHGWLTTPKFGSSTSGGGEIEPGPERD